MRGVGIDFGKPPVLDSGDDTASGNAHGTISVKLFDSHASDLWGHHFVRQLLTTNIPARLRRNQKQSISRKGAKAAKGKMTPNLAFLASWRENNPNHRNKMTAAA
jgi:hypothetical protein